MKRTAIAAAAILAGVAANAGTVDKFSEQFDNNYTFDSARWTGVTGNAEVSTDQKTTGTHSLFIDSSEEVNYSPAATNVSVVSLDVYLTPGADAPDLKKIANSKLVIYLATDKNLKGCVDGSNWETIASNVEGNTWTNLTMTFSAGSVTVKMADGTQKVFENSGVPATVTSVGFQGSGYVDNFVGKCQMNNYAYTDGDTGTAGETSGSAEIGVNGNKVTFNYSNVTGMQFVRVYDDQGKYVTLRVNSNNGTVDVSKLKGTITKVVAYYGESVSNVDGSTPTTPTGAQVTNDNDTPTVGVTVNGKSGVYYTLVVPDTSTAITGSASVLVAPQNDGEPVTLTAPVSRNAWGTVKFQVKATDTSLTNGN